MAKKWSDSDTEKLTKLASSKSIDELSRLFKTEKSEIENRLTELGLDFSTRQSVEDDPGLPFFIEALKPLHEHDWEKAQSLFEKAIAKTDRSHLAERARQYRAICLRHTVGKASDDPYLQAVFEKNSGDLDSALQLCEDHGNATEDERYAYLLASIQALRGNADEAIANLATAIQLEPKNRVHAYHDPDFESLQGQDEFSQLISSGSSGGSSGASSEASKAPGPVPAV